MPDQGSKGLTQQTLLQARAVLHGLRMLLHRMTVARMSLPDLSSIKDAAHRLNESTHLRCRAVR